MAGVEAGFVLVSDKERKHFKGMLRAVVYLKVMYLPCREEEGKFSLGL